ncbi:MAG: winged helix-turn-helix transcriptional regulator [Treponema sp.]|uniref:autorepressor SdpR family transcription factor n=1 Tax=Treponema sp. TaxID=166 RepID=UPI00298EB7E1|nr:autorepressor SdpR family transcription factor [Treponema sp.]MBR5934037.1 winged helix-turn-helix transcriptional regulator [Treponema sp.]
MAFADTFKALSDPARREILELLRETRLSAGDIASRFDMTGATISYHLSVLKKADLIRETREKNFIFYELNVSVFEELMLWINQFNSKSKKKK